jgi:hypothetical protein
VTDRTRQTYRDGLVILAVIVVLALVWVLSSLAG